MSNKIKRSLVKSLLNTGTLAVPVWSIIGSGVTAGTINYNPKTTEETYIDEDSATVLLESYAPSMPIESTAIEGNAVYDYIEALRKGRFVLDDAETEVVNVYLYETPALTYYLAEKQAVSISVESFGGDGGKAVKLNYTLNYRDDPVAGEFSPSESEFVATPVNTILTTMVIGAVTLTPLFADDHSRLHYAGNVANGTATVSMTSTLSGATIVQEDESAVVGQGANAALSVGVNHLTITVTVGDEEVVYKIDITRAAA